MAVVKGDVHVIRTFYISCHSLSNALSQRQLTCLYPDKAVAVSLFFLSLSLESIKVTVDEKVKICDERILQETPFQTCAGTEQTAMADVVASLTKKAQSQKMKRWPSNLFQSKSRSGADTGIPACCKQDCCFGVCSFTVLKLKRAEELQKSQSERRQKLLKLLSPNAFFQLSGFWLCNKLLAKTFRLRNGKQVSV